MRTIDVHNPQDMRDFQEAFTAHKYGPDAHVRVRSYSEEGRMLTDEEHAEQRGRELADGSCSPSFKQYMRVSVPCCCEVGAYSETGKRLENFDPQEHYFPLDDTRDKNYQYPAPVVVRLPWYKRFWNWLTQWHYET